MATYKQHSACTTPAALCLKDSGMFQSPLSQLHHRQEGRSGFLWAGGSPCCWPWSCARAEICQTSLLQLQQLSWGKLLGVLGSSPARSVLWLTWKSWLSRAPRKQTYSASHRPPSAVSSFPESLQSGSLQNGYIGGYLYKLILSMSFLCLN